MAITALIVTVLLLPTVINLMTDAVPEQLLRYRWISIPVALVLTAFLAVRHVLERRANNIGLNDLISKMADDLALAIDKQWKDEFRFRGLNDPYPFQITWQSAPNSLAEGLDEVQDVANNWSKESPFRTQFKKKVTSTIDTSSHPQENAKSGDDLARFLIEDVPTKRLVVLGAGGSGKSVLMLRLVQGLLNRRSPGDPVPVLLSISSWDPQSKDLWHWLRDQLYLDHPTLRDPVTVATNAESRAELLINRSLIFPVLDGLDEMAPSMIEDAVEAISNALDENQAIVLSSRTNEYQNLMSSATSRKLVGAAGIMLNDLDVASVESYLRHSASGGVKSNDRWSKVLAAVPRDAAIATILANPLMVALARTIYSFHQGTGTKAPPNPEELLDRVRFPEIEDLRSYLLSAFVPAAYRQSGRKSHSASWRADKAERWLIALAQHLELGTFGEPHRDGTSIAVRKTDLAWWELADAIPRWWVPTAAGLLAGIPAGIAAWLNPESGVGVGISLLVGIPVGLSIQGRLRAKLGTDRPMVTKSTAALGAGLLGGLVGGIIGASSRAAGGDGGIAGGLAVGFATGGLCGPLGGFVGGMIGALVGQLFAGHGSGFLAGVATAGGASLAVGLVTGISGRREPARGFGHSSRGIWIGLFAGIVMGAAVGTGAWLGFGRLVGVAGGLAAFIILGLVAGLSSMPADLQAAVSPRSLLTSDRLTFWSFAIVGGMAGALAIFVGVTVQIGIAAGLVGAVGLAFFQATWGRYTLARAYLAFRRKLPWRLMSFLVDAHQERQVLRQVGGIYQFRHLDLQHHLAKASDPGAAEMMDVASS